LKAHIFREYDIRGRVADELGQEDVYLLGRSLGTYFRQRGAKSISLGRDCRLSSPELAKLVARGLASTGTAVVDLGVVPTPLLYFSLFNLGVDGGIQITGSHNPPEYNGFKVCLGTTTIYGEEIQEIRKIGESGVFADGNGKLETAEIITPYVKDVLGGVKAGPVPRKVVVDAETGLGGS
jgi:phosphomannomutase/phosphoglucomutase